MGPGRQRSNSELFVSHFRKSPMKLRGPRFYRPPSLSSFAPGSIVLRQFCNVRAKSLGVALFGLTQLLCACTGSSQSPAVAPSPRVSPRVSPPASPVVEQVPRTIITPTSAATLPELLAEANSLLEAGEARQAALLFDKVVQLEPLGELAVPALMGAGLSYEAIEAWDESATRFEGIAQASATSPLIASNALLRATRVRLHLGQWPQAQALGELLLQRFPKALALETIVAHTGWSLGALDKGDTESADFHIAKALSVVERLALDRAGRIPRDLAMLYFALGESRRQQAKSARLNPDPAHFAKSLELRCSRLLEAQSAYSDSMRAHDAHWSTLSGLRVGELYADLHKELLDIPPPRKVQDSEQRLFEGAMRQRYSVLLNKALTMIDHTVSMSERTGVAPQWRERAVRLRIELQAAVVREQSILDGLPYTGTELRQAMDALAKRPD